MNGLSKHYNYYNDFRDFKMCLKIIQKIYGYIYYLKIKLLINLSFLDTGLFKVTYVPPRYVRFRQGKYGLSFNILLILYKLYTLFFRLSIFRKSRISFSRI